MDEMDGESMETVEIANPIHFVFCMWCLIAGSIVAGFGSIACLLYVGLVHGDWTAAGTSAMGCITAGCLLMAQGRAAL